MAGGVCLVVLATALHSPGRSAAQELPDDDGAPASDYEPSPEARIADVPGTGSLAAAFPETPPVDNAFPIWGRTSGSCSNGFGAPRGGDRLHKGVDCFAPLGTPLVAVEAGTIRYAQTGEAFSCSSGGDISGNRVSLRGRSGYVYYYGHLDTIAVGNDQEVAEGDVIGTVGRTGNASCSGPHLHFEVKCGDDAEPFDPYPWMATWAQPSAPPAGLPSTDRLGVGVAYSGEHRQDLFANACGQAMLQRTWWSTVGVRPAWFPVDGIAASDPDAASPGAGRDPEVFVRGTDNAVYWLTWAGSYWNMWYLGGICTSGPTAVYSGPRHVDVFCRGTDRALYARSWDASTGLSAGWAKVGGIATSDPDAAWRGPGYNPEVFVRGTDGAAYQVIWDGSSWVTLNLGGACSSGPSAAYSGPDRLDVFCRGSDMALYHRSWRRATGWTPTWARIESKILSDPEASSRGPGYPPEVVVRGVDRRLYEFAWNGSAWVSSIWGVT